MPRVESVLSDVHARARVTTIVPPRANEPASTQAGQTSAAAPTQIPLDLFQVPDGFEVALWASSPMLRKSTNIDIDRDRPHLVAEGVRYHSSRPWRRTRSSSSRTPIATARRTRRAPSSRTALIAPLGVAVIDNDDRVSQPPT